MAEPDTFTLREMREAYIKFVNGEPMTDKERVLAEAKHNAVMMCGTPLEE